MKDEVSDAFGLPRDKNKIQSKPFKETLAYQGAKKLYKQLTKNMIPSDPQKILEMEKRLTQEDELKTDADRAKKHIKEILKARKEAYKEVKRERRRKIKAFFKKFFRKK